MIVYNGVPLSQGDMKSLKNSEQKLTCQLYTLASYGIKGCFPIGLLASP